jgi:hypothetical protein
MSIYDKFGIIENHIQDDQKKVLTKIENYFENYLNSDIKVLGSGYIEQIIYFDKIKIHDLLSNIKLLLKNYLIQRRNNMRTFIRKESFDFTNLNKFLKNFIMKIEYLNNTLKTNNEIFKEATNLLSSLIISDSIIMMFFEEQIVLLDSNMSSDIESLISAIKDLNKYDNKEIYNQILKIFGNFYLKNILSIKNTPLPENINRINKLNESLQLCKNIYQYYNYIKEDANIINYPLYQLSLDTLIEIIKCNPIEEVNFTLETIWHNLNTHILNHNFNGKQDIVNKITNEIVNIIDKNIKQQIETKDTVIMENIIGILKFASKILDRANQDILNQKIASILTYEQNLDIINIYINNQIKKYNSNDAIDILSFVLNVKEKDLFLAKYYQLLTQRLMDNISNKNVSSNEREFIKYIKCEKDVLTFLQNNFGDKLTYKINKVISDTEYSFQDNMNFNQIIIPNFINKLNVITTSYNNWDINQSDGILSSSVVESIKDSQITQQLYKYQQFYGKRYDNKRVLNWYPHFGEVNITFANLEFKMLPIQFMVLELFEKSEQINIKDVLNSKFFENYSSKFKNDIIGSLINSGLLRLSNDKLILSDQFNRNNFKTDLIEIFFTVLDYTNIWEQKRKEELIHSREEIIYTNINHQLKKSKLSYNDLLVQIKNNINVFEVDNAIFDKALNYMIKMDYINKNEKDLYQKLYY